MLALDPSGYSPKHYNDFFTNPDWQGALANSLRIAPGSNTAVNDAGDAGGNRTVAEPYVPFRGAIMAVLISLMIVPLIISAAGMYFFYSRIGMQGTYLGVVMAHAVLGTPFVIITVTATLVGFDKSLVRAGQHGGKPGYNLLPGSDAPYPAGRDFRGIVRLYHLI